AGNTAVLGGPNLAIGVSNGIGTQATNIIGGFNIVAHIGPGTAVLPAPSCPRNEKSENIADAEAFSPTALARVKAEYAVVAWA
ncbi:hypothetical protein C6A85_13415, partial [Mycobacterium sp. ITM-2017-0098]